MVSLHTILNGHRSRQTDRDHLHNSNVVVAKATVSEIPDLFFDQILTHYKLSRVEIIVLMYLYRKVWCRPNLYKTHGISQLLSHTEMSKAQGLSLDEVYHAIVKLEEYDFIGTIRSGQYFVRKYFTKESDFEHNQTYDDFEF